MTTSKKFIHNTTIKSTAVSHAVYSGDVLFLVKGSHLEAISKDFTLLGTLTVNGQLVHLSSLKDDKLLLVTDQLLLGIVSFTEGQFSIIKKFQLQGVTAVNRQWPLLLSRVGDQLLVVAREGFLNVFTIKNDQIQENSLAIEEINIVVVQMIASNQVAVLYQDHRNERHMKLYRILSDKIVELKSVAVHESAYYMILVQKTKLVVFDKNDVTLYQIPNMQKLSAIACRHLICSHVEIPNSSFLLGHQDGSYSTLRVGQSMKLTIGEGILPYPSCLVSANDDTVFIGSLYGDSQVVKLQDYKKISEVVHTFQNLGPLVDMHHVDGANMFVAAAGKDASGSLKSIQGGIGLKDYVKFDLPNVLKVFSVLNDTVLVISLLNESKLIGLVNGEMEAITVDTFNHSSSTLLACQLGEQQWCQVTCSGYFLFNQFAFVQQWQSDLPIVAACANSSAIVVALNNRTLLYFSVSITPDRIVPQPVQIQLDEEVSCLSMTNDTLAIGFWGNGCVQLFSVPKMQQLCSVTSDGMDTIPRQVLLVSLDDIFYLFIAMSDGQIIQYQYTDGATVNMKQFSLGKTPAKLSFIMDDSHSFIFVVSDKSAIVKSSKGKLQYFPVNNADNVKLMCSFNNMTYQEGLLLCRQTDTGTEATLCKMDSTERIHVVTTRVGQQLQKICANSELVYAITHGYGPTKHQSSVRCYDLPIKSELSCFDFSIGEMATSLAIFDFAELQYVLVGVAVFTVGEYDQEPQRGRVHLFQCQPKTHLLVRKASYDVNGAVYSIAHLCGSKFVMSVQNSVVLMDMSVSSSNQYTIKEIGSKKGYVLTVNISVNEDTILLGDIVQSLSLLRFDKSANSLTEVFRDYHQLWITSSCFQDKETFVCADKIGQIVFMKAALSPEHSISQSLWLAAFNVGEPVNQLVSGSLMTSAVGSSEEKHESISYCTISGATGTFTALDDRQYEILALLESVLSPYIDYLGFGHFEFRRCKFKGIKYAQENEIGQFSGVVDGDFVQLFLSRCSSKQRQDIIEKLNNLGRQERGADFKVAEAELVTAIEDLTHM